MAESYDVTILSLFAYQIKIFRVSSLTRSYFDPSTSLRTGSQISIILAPLFGES